MSNKFIGCCAPAITTPARDEELAAHLNVVAGRVPSQFPRNQLLVHVMVIDTPEAESFSVAPERI